MSYDSEALAAIRKNVERTVEQEHLRGGSDTVSLVLITPYLLFHVLDKLQSIDDTLITIMSNQSEV